MKYLIEEIKKYGKYHQLPCYPYLLLRKFDKYTREVKEHNKRLDDLLREFSNLLCVD